VRTKNKQNFTLKLDAAWQPLEIIDSFRAFNMCLTGRAKQIVQYDDGRPAVIVLKSYVRRFQFSLSCNRRNVFWRDDNKCQYCLDTFAYSNLTMDHVNPRSKGGIREWSNIVTSCKECNTTKRNRTPKEANMMLLRKPFTPRVKMMDLYRNIPIQEEWKDFLRS